jgi:hypothetical protein
MTTKEFKTKEEFNNYLRSNNIGRVTVADLCGYNKLLEVVRVCKESYILGSNYCYEFYIVLEKFNGSKEYTEMTEVEREVKSFNRRKVTNRQFVIVNAEFDEQRGIVEVPEKEYKPTYKAIYEHIYNKMDFLKYTEDSLETALTKMGEQQMNELQAKLNILGITWILADYNTIVMIDKRINKLLIYTMQSEVIKG